MSVPWVHNYYFFSNSPQGGNDGDWSNSDNFFSDSFGSSRPSDVGWPSLPTANDQVTILTPVTQDSLGLIVSVGCYCIAFQSEWGGCIDCSLSNPSLHPASDQWNGFTGCLGVDAYSGGKCDYVDVCSDCGDGSFCSGPLDNNGHCCDCGNLGCDNLCNSGMGYDCSFVCGGTCSSCNGEDVCVDGMSQDNYGIWCPTPDIDCTGCCYGSAVSDNCGTCNGTCWDNCCGGNCCPDRCSDDQSCCASSTDACGVCYGDSSSCDCGCGPNAPCDPCGCGAGDWWDCTGTECGLCGTCDQSGACCDGGVIGCDGMCNSGAIVDCTGACTATPCPGCDICGNCSAVSHSIVFPTAGQVQAGVDFGCGGSQTGTLSGGGGGTLLPTINVGAIIGIPMFIRV